jgi:hypothetical protein
MSEQPQRPAGRRFPRINSECPSCGEVEFPPERGWLVEMSIASMSYFCFVCPQCDHQVRHQASARARAILSRWVPTEYIQVPHEVLEPRPATALTVDEVLDVMLAMREIELLTQEAAAGLKSGTPNQLA